MDIMDLLRFLKALHERYKSNILKSGSIGLTLQFLKYAWLLTLSG